MRIAYLICIHKQPAMLRRLVRQLANERDTVLVHVDKSAPADVHDGAGEVAAAFPNVYLLRSIEVVWGGWSQVQAELNAFAYLCRAAHKWDYFINLSGQDFPIKPVDELRAFLSDHDGHNFVDVRRVEDLNPRLKKVIERRRTWPAVEWGGRSVRLPLWARPWLGRARYYGSSWHMLSRRFCEWVDAEGWQAARHMRFMRSADEAFMQAMVMDGPFADSLVRDNRRFYLFRGSPNPEVLTLDHFDQLAASRAFFARKMDSKRSAALLEAVEGTLLT